jgi:hypothetical protein
LPVVTILPIVLTVAVLAPVGGISDLIDEKADADWGEPQEITACHASAFAFQMLSKLKFSPESDHRLAGVCQSVDQRLESQLPALGSKPVKLPSPDQLRSARQLTVRL